MQIIDGRSFDGGVSDPGPMPAPAAEPQKRELTDEYIPILSNLFTDGLKDSPDKQECGNLLMRRVYLNKECAAFIEKQRVSVREKLIEQHEAVKGEAREQQGRIDKLRAEIASWEGELNRRKDSQARAVSVLRGAEQRRKELSRFASRTAILAADEAIEKATAKVEKTNAVVVEAQQRINHLRLVEFQPLLDELTKISAEEMRLSAAITGQGYTSELGIVVPARPPIV
jgi:uncharacterized small protein (DUF1192 family)